MLIVKLKKVQFLLRKVTKVGFRGRKEENKGKKAEK